ncbi:MAG: cyclic pyranopterin monophosphate synthase MoaC [Pseudomonadota bacterium]
MTQANDKRLTHVDDANRARMVDVSDKKITERVAEAEATVWLPQAVLEAFSDSNGELASAKGPVFSTAVIAGVMAAKKTHELIPFCHPLGLTGCEIDIQLDGHEVTVRCACKVNHKTGVEMEALTGASVAALTIYDMCKAVSHEIEIRATRLIAKSGGKHDFQVSTDG